MVVEACQEPWHGHLRSHVMDYRAGTVHYIGPQLILFLLSFWQYAESVVVDNHCRRELQRHGLLIEIAL